MNVDETWMVIGSKNDECGLFMESKTSYLVAIRALMYSANCTRSENYICC